MTTNESLRNASDCLGTPAILVGDPRDVPGFEVHHFNSILWFVDGADSLPPLDGVSAGASLRRVALEGLTAADALAALEQFRRRDSFSVPQLFVSRRLAADTGGSHAGVLAHVRTCCERWQLEAGLVQRVGFARQKNFLLNVTEYVQRQVPAAWAGALRGLPAFVCGSGPSLDVSVAALAAVADRGVVFAADSALRTLARHGIVADLAVSLSSRKPPERCLASDAEPVRVILSTLSPVSWREVIAPDRRYFLSRSHPTGDWLAEQGVTITPVVAVENCGITELELARFLGCAPIHLFGFDFAADAARPAAFYNADVDPAIEHDDLPAILLRVPGNYAMDVPTFVFADWQACDARLATWPEGLVHNVNDRGARLRHARLVHPRQFVLSAGGVPKRLALARLAAPVMENPEKARAALAALGAQGTLGCRALPELRFALEQRGPVALAAELRRLFGRPDFSRALGSLTAKLLPYLLAAPPQSVAFWQGALVEMEEVCCLAESVYGGVFV